MKCLTTLLMLVALTLTASACDKNDANSRAENTMERGASQISKGTQNIAKGVGQAGEAAGKEIKEDLNDFKNTTKRELVETRKEMKQLAAKIDRKEDKMQAELKKDLRQMEVKAERLETRLEKIDDKAENTIRLEIANELKELSGGINKLAKDVAVDED